METKACGGKNPEQRVTQFLVDILRLNAFFTPKAPSRPESWNIILEDRSQKQAHKILQEFGLFKDI